MRIPVLVLVLVLAGAADARTPGTYKELPPGRYSVAVHGMICTVCARAIAAEWSKLPEVDNASMDYDKETGIVSIRLDRTMKVSALARALRRAERVANLGAHYELRDVQYIP
jgi:cation transport ATPase